MRASLGRYLALQSDLDNPVICLLRENFPELGDVPTDAGTCDCRALTGCWNPTVLFGLAGDPGVEFEGAGLLMKTEGGDLYRARVLVAGSSSDDGMLSIEYEGVM